MVPHFNQQENVTKHPRILSINETSQRIGLSRSSLYILMKAGDFPEKVQITQARIGFLEHEISEWINERASNRPIINQ